MTGTVDAAEFPAASMGDLPTLLGIVEQAGTRAGADADARFALRLAAEESFINIIQHGYHGAGPIWVEVWVEPGCITLRLRDHAPPFDPQSAPPPDLDADWDARDVGGLGWHLLRKMMDHVEWRHEGTRGNVLTLVKNVPGQPAGA